MRINFLSYMSALSFLLFFSSFTAESASEEPELDLDTTNFYEVDTSRPVTPLAVGASGARVYMFSPISTNSRSSSDRGSVFDYSERKGILKKARLEEKGEHNNRLAHFVGRELAESSFVSYLMPFGRFRTRSTVVSSVQFDMPAVLPVPAFERENPLPFFQQLLKFLKQLKSFHDLGFSHNDINTEHLRTFEDHWVLIDWGNAFAFSDDRSRPRTWFDGTAPYSHFANWEERTKEDVRDLALIILELLTGTQDWRLVDLIEENAEEWESNLRSMLSAFDFANENFINLILRMTLEDREARPALEEIINLMQSVLLALEDPDSDLAEDQDQALVQTERSLNQYPPVYTVQAEREEVYSLLRRVFNAVNEARNHELPLNMLIDALSIIEILPDSLVDVGLELRVMYALGIGSSFYTERLSAEEIAHELSRISGVSPRRLGTFGGRFQSILRILMNPGDEGQAFNGFVVDHPLRVFMQNYHREIRTMNREDFTTIVDGVYDFMLNHTWQFMSRAELTAFHESLLHSWRIDLQLRQEQEEFTQSIRDELRDDQVRQQERVQIISEELTAVALGRQNIARLRVYPAVLAAPALAARALAVPAFLALPTIERRRLPHSRSALGLNTLPQLPQRSLSN